VQYSIFLYCCHCRVTQKITELMHFLLFHCNKVTRTPFNMALYAHLSFSLNCELKSVISHYFAVHLRLAQQLIFVSRRNVTWKLLCAFELHWNTKYISSFRYIRLYIPTFYDHRDESALFWPIVTPFSLSLSVPCSMFMVFHPF
jgi:hypothetical protein